MKVDFSHLVRVVSGRKASDVTAHQMRNLLGLMMRIHGIFGDTPGQFAFIADMLQQCSESDEQLRVLCMRLARLICVVHVDAIGKCLATDYGIGDDIERPSN
ncbi:MAG TPA: hypothetical protein VE967_19580 [Gemmatimonadaceae bacterium]|nr:hypothetical protein [Gemmatimonadaceae bacterium]